MRVNSFRFSRCFSREPTRILGCDEALRIRSLGRANHLRLDDPRTRTGHCLFRLFLVSCVPHLQVQIRFNKETRKAGRKNGALVLCHSLILGCMRVNSFRFSRCFSREPTRILSCDEALVGRWMLSTSRSGFSLTSLTRTGFSLTSLPLAERMRSPSLAEGAQSDAAVIGTRKSRSHKVGYVARGNTHAQG